MARTSAIICGILTAVSACAGTDSAAVVVRVVSVDILSVSDPGACVVEMAPGAASGTAVDNTARLNYSHNDSATRKILASTTSILDSAGETPGIDLTVEVADGNGEQIILTSGAANEARAVVSGIAAGALTDKAVTYRATAHAHNTRDGEYSYLVTFTSVSE